MSVASYVVRQMIALYELLFEASQKVSIITRVVAMANYVAPMNMPINTRIDLSSLSKCVKKDPTKLHAKCDAVGLKCVSFELAAKRVVLYAKFIVEKERSPF